MRLLSWLLRFLRRPAPGHSDSTGIWEKRLEGWKFSAPVNVEEIEAAWFKELPELLKGRPDLPQAPFGFVNDRWEQFKAQLREGDDLVRFCTDRSSWKNLAGREGVAILRLGCVADTFVITMN